jgi:uncharacterized protein involved in response to NO
MPLSQAPYGLPLLRLGFRPFYLAAAAAAVVLMLTWLAVHAGRLVPASGLNPVLWHAHEMLFGFVAAVIVGFLLTAGRTWTGLPTPRGAQLGALVLLWLAGRAASVLAPYPVYFLVDLMFLPIVAASFADLLVRSRNGRNLPVAGVLILLAVANLAFHLGAAGVVDVAPLKALHAAIALVVLLISIIAGRVIPLFTRNALPGVPVASSRRWDQLTAGLTAAGLVAWVAGVDGATSALLLFAAAAGHAVRWARWSPWATLRRPVLWILHIGYAWIPIGLLMLAASCVGAVDTTAAVHALAVGAMGGLIVGMVTRTARGHTGRTLEVSSVEVAAYVVIVAAAVTRVAAALAPPTVQGAGLVTAGGLWIVAFGLYLFRFAPWLAAPRLDGKDG